MRFSNNFPFGHNLSLKIGQAIPPVWFEDIHDHECLFLIYYRYYSFEILLILINFIRIKFYIL